MPTPAANERMIGLVGIGLLGSTLAERLLHAGFEVHGYDIASEALRGFAAAGGQAAASPDDVARGCRQIVLCLPNSNVVTDVLQHMEPHLQFGTIIVDTTTGDPQQTRKSGLALAASGVELIDATVLGSSEVTRQGDAVLMVGATDAGMQRGEPILRALSGAIHHVGPVGSGQEMKLVANLVLGLNRAALAEGLHFAKSLELDLDRVLNVLKSGAAYSKVMDAKGRRMIDGEFAPQARLSQHLKDVRLILDRAKQAGTQLPLSEIHRELLERVESAGDGHLDNSAVIRAW